MPAPRGVKGTSTNCIVDRDARAVPGTIVWPSPLTKMPLLLRERFGSTRPRIDVEFEGIRAGDGQSKPLDGGVTTAGPRRNSPVKGSHAGQAGANRRRSCSVGEAPEALEGLVGTVRDKLIVESTRPLPARIKPKKAVLAAAPMVTVSDPPSPQNLALPACVREGVATDNGGKGGRGRGSRDQCLRSHRSRQYAARAGCRHANTGIGRVGDIVARGEHEECSAGIIDGVGVGHPHPD